MGRYWRDWVLVDGAAIKEPVASAHIIRPYARAMVRICKEESHQRQGRHHDENGQGSEAQSAWRRMR